MKPHTVRRLQAAEGTKGRRKHGRMDGKDRHDGSTEAQRCQGPVVLLALQLCWWMRGCLRAPSLSTQKKAQRKKKDNNKRKWGSQHSQYSQWCKATTATAEREQRSRQRVTDTLKDIQSICISTDTADHHALQKYQQGSVCVCWRNACIDCYRF